MLNVSFSFHLIHNSCICPIFWMKRQMNGSPQIPYLVEKPVLKAKQIPLGLAILAQQTINYQEKQVRLKDTLCYVHYSCTLWLQTEARFTLRSPSETELPSPSPFPFPVYGGTEEVICMHARMGADVKIILNCSTLLFQAGPLIQTSNSVSLGSCSRVPLSAFRGWNCAQTPVLMFVGKHKPLSCLPDATCFLVRFSHWS